MTAFTPGLPAILPGPQAWRGGADTVAMDIQAWLNRVLRTDDDALASHRDRIALILSTVSAVLLVPFIVNHLLAHRHVLGALIFVTQVMLGTNAWALRRGRAAPVPFWLMTVGFMLAVCGSIQGVGASGTYWAFPAVFISYFVLQRKLALLLSVGFALVATSMAWQVLGTAVGVRFGATLALTLVMINVVLNVVGDLQQALVQQTLTDPLTGAYNRRHLARQLALLTRPGADVHGMNALLAIDIDHFKAINDRHGHAAGDAVLVALVHTLSARKRHSDMLFRTGGEEFVLLLPRTAASDARQVAEHLRARIADTALLAGQTITVSIGVGVQQPHHTADAWLDAADRALYQAKHNGRNRVEMSA
jgi:diguanylate cyclase (GGDEF)-like protein